MGKLYRVPKAAVIDYLNSGENAKRPANKSQVEISAFGNNEKGNKIKPLSISKSERRLTR